MHPLTLYDVLVDEHRRVTAQRDREHLLAQRRRERPASPRRSRARRASRTAARPAVA